LRTFIKIPFFKFEIFIKFQVFVLLGQFSSRRSRSSSRLSIAIEMHMRKSFKKEKFNKIAFGILISKLTKLVKIEKA